MGDQGRKSPTERHSPNAGDIDFLASVGHDLRTQVGVVLTTAELLLESRLDERQTRHANMLHDAATMLNTLLGDLLDHAKLEAGSFTIEERPFLPGALFSAAVDAVRPKAEAKGVAVQLALDPTVPPHLVGDPLRVRQVLANLLDNAIKFTDEGSVRVEVRVDHGREALRLVFSVADTGIGLDPEEQARVFLPYAQASSDTARRFGGTGLGLTIARSLAERMGGGLGLVSKKGVGTTFTAVVACHAAPEPEVSETLPASAFAEGDPLAGLKVLVVDDNTVNRTLIGTLLERFSVSFQAVESGATAISKIAGGEAFDLVLMDLKMPEMDGIEAAQQIHANALGRQIPIVALTASPSEDRRLVAHEAEFVAILAKPIQLSRLYETLCRVAGRPC